MGVVYTSNFFLERFKIPAPKFRDLTIHEVNLYTQKYIHSFLVLNRKISGIFFCVCLRRSMNFFMFPFLFQKSFCFFACCLLIYFYFAVILIFDVLSFYFWCCQSLFCCLYIIVVHIANQKVFFVLDTASPIDAIFFWFSKITQFARFVISHWIHVFKTFFANLKEFTKITCL